MFDLILTPLNRMPDLPGFQATAAPRRVDRHRASDLLAVCLSSATAQPLTPELAAEAFQRLSEVYYRTGGTVTSAIKEAVEALNENLLARSDRAAQILTLNLCVMRGSLAYIAHAGPTHTIHLSNGSAADYYDPSSAGRGLGASRSVPLRFFQTTLAEGDGLLLVTDPPESWPDALAGLSARDGAALLARAPEGLRGGLLRFENGSGQVRSEPLAPAAAPTPAPVVPVPAQSAPGAQSHPAIPPAPARSTPTEQAATPAPEAESLEPVATESEPPVTPETPLVTTSVTSQARRRVQERRAQMAAAAGQAPAAKKPGLGGLLHHAPAVSQPTTGAPAGPNPLARRIAAFFRRMRKARVRAGRAVGGALPRIPGAQASMTPSTATLIFIAVAIPIIVTAAATAMYFRAGASEQRIVYMQQARGFADLAAAQTDNTQRRANWEQVMYWVNKSEEFGQDDESITLRRKAQAAMDSLDGIVRLALAPAFTGVLADSINVTRMAATNNELYLLDATSGRVLRMTRATRSYEYDPNFSCGPGPVGNKIIGPLVGMATLPPNTASKASVLAVDALGNLLYCKPGETPEAAVLAAPENNWGKITAMALNNGDLYVLDLQNNAVWRFDGVDYAFSDRPRLFFGNEVPNLADVIDIALYSDDLYLLRSSGQMTVCTYSGFDFSPTRCNDPAPYGAADGAVQSFSDAGFLQMVTTQPPDPSLFMLDSKGPAIYHFSLRLNFQREMRQDPEQERDFPLPKKPVTAFAINPNRVVFLAFRNQVVFGAIP